MKPTEEEIAYILYHPKVKTTEKNGWFISSTKCGPGTGYFYLHKDGKVRGVATYGGELTGYWRTESEAKVFHENWKKKYFNIEKKIAVKPKKIKRFSGETFLNTLKEIGYD